VFEMLPEGIGKSLFWVWLVAYITTGTAFPGFGIPAREPGLVVLVLTEDDWSKDVRPRLELAGADLGMIKVICTDTDGSVSQALFCVFSSLSSWKTRCGDMPRMRAASLPVSPACLRSATVRRDRAAAWVWPAAASWTARRASRACSSSGP
jgi:hypothetical protein